MLVFMLHYVVRVDLKPSSLNARLQTFLTGNTRIPVPFLQLNYHSISNKHIAFNKSARDRVVIMNFIRNLRF